MDPRRVSLLLLLSAALLLLVGGLAAAQDSTSSPSPTAGPADHPPAPRTADQQPALFTGTYVRFVFDPFTCALHDLSVYGAEFFDVIELTAPCTTLRSFQAGGTFGVRGAGETLLLYDSKNGFLSFTTTADGVLRFRAGPDAEIVGEGSSREIRVQDLTARVFPLNEHYTLGWSDQGFLAIGARGNFLVEEPAATNAPVAHALEERRIGGEVNFFLRDGEVDSQVLAYEDVDMRASHPAENAFRVILDSDLPTGRTFVANFPTGLFDGQQMGVDYYTLDDDGVARLDQIATAQNLADVLEAADPGPEYWIVSDAEGTHVLVSVPQWSVHMFEILGLPAELVPIIIYGAVLGLIFTALAGFGMFTSRRQPD